MPIFMSLLLRPFTWLVFKFCKINNVLLIEIKSFHPIFAFQGQFLTTTLNCLRFLNLFSCFLFSFLLLLQFVCELSGQWKKVCFFIEKVLGLQNQRKNGIERKWYFFHFFLTYCEKKLFQEGLKKTFAYLKMKVKNSLEQFILTEQS